jgi:hypothetical protein
MMGSNWGIVTLTRTPAFVNWRLISSAHQKDVRLEIDKELGLAPEVTGTCRF